MSAFPPVVTAFCVREGSGFDVGADFGDDAGDGKRVGTLVLFGWEERWNQSMGKPPAPSEETVENRECLVSGRTDSITR